MLKMHEKHTRDKSKKTHTVHGYTPLVYRMYLIREPHVQDSLFHSTCFFDGHDMRATKKFNRFHFLLQYDFLHFIKTVSDSTDR